LGIYVEKNPLVVRGITSAHNSVIFTGKQFFVSPNIRKLGDLKPPAFWSFDSISKPGRQFDLMSSVKIGYFKKLKI